MTDLSLIIDELHAARAESKALDQDAREDGNTDRADDFAFISMHLTQAIQAAMMALTVWKLYE
jgi:hypothetical protein